MRAHILLLALSVFVVAVSAEWVPISRVYIASCKTYYMLQLKRFFAFRETKPEDVVKNIKKGMEVVYKFFYEDPLGKKIAQLAKDWKEAMLEARSKVRASLAEYIRGLKNEAA
uniref:Low molecular weight antigen 2 variant 1 n=1 Tax=Taenia solium TaxID=6204 RepID=Q9GRB1_TAESO|nr:low molecular weight antigen 2 variant 1 [Taenia solium]BAB18646.1 low molecular weight antigen 2 variant 1 [Taenia solium]